MSVFTAIFILCYFGLPLLATRRSDRLGYLVISAAIALGIVTALVFFANRTGTVHWLTYNPSNPDPSGNRTLTVAVLPAAGVTTGLALAGLWLLWLQGTGRLIYKHLMRKLWWVGHGLLGLTGTILFTGASNFGAGTFLDPMASTWLSSFFFGNASIWLIIPGLICLGLVLLLSLIGLIKRSDQ